MISTDWMKFVDSKFTRETIWKEFGLITFYFMQPSSQFANAMVAQLKLLNSCGISSPENHIMHNFPILFPIECSSNWPGWMQLVITCRKFPSTTIWCITSTVSKGESSTPDRVQVELHLSFTSRRGVLLTIRRKIETHFHTGRKQFSILHDWVASFPAASVVSRSGAFAGNVVKGSMIDAKRSWILLP